MTEWSEQWGWWMGGRGPFRPPRHRGHGRGGFRSPGDNLRAAFEWMGGEPPPRAERGEVRFLVLHAIEDAARHGYEIIQFIEDRTSGRYRPSPGVIYPTLQMLEEMGQARVEEREGRKLYAITDEGKKELDAHRDSINDFYDRFGEEPWEAYADQLVDIFGEVKELFKVIRRGTRRGYITPDAMRAIRGVVEDAVRRIEQILAGDRDARK
jgi:DNA-binding PadR family transcriptional regulator